MKYYIYFCREWQTNYHNDRFVSTPVSIEQVVVHHIGVMIQMI